MSSPKVHRKQESPIKISADTHGKEAVLKAARDMLKTVVEFDQPLTPVTVPGSNMLSEMMQLELSPDVMIEVYVITHDRENADGSYKPVRYSEVYADLTA